MAVTLALPDDMPASELMQLVAATGKRLRSTPLPPKPKDIPDGIDRSVTDIRSGRRLAGQDRSPGKDPTQ